MASSMNLKVMRGATNVQIRDAMNYSQFLVKDNEIEGVRVTDHPDGPVLLSVKFNDEDVPTNTTIGVTQPDKISV
jgi:hypothetical protein